MTLSVDALQRLNDHSPLRRYVVIPATAALATLAEVAVETGCPNQHFFIRRLRLKDAGTAATWNVRISGTTGFASADAYVTLRATDTELNSGTPINESLEQDDGWVLTDANGRLYLLFTFGAATNHVISGAMLLEAITLLTLAVP